MTRAASTSRGRAAPVARSAIQAKLAHVDAQRHEVSSNRSHSRTRGAATVSGGDRARLFVALRLPLETIGLLVPWQERELRGRVVPPGNLHVTLAFLGSRSIADVEPVARALREAAYAAGRPVLAVRGYRETRSVGMLELDDDGGRAAALAEDVHSRLERLGVYRREARPWLAHLTVLRFRERPRLRPELPDLGRFSPSEAAVYHSVLRPGGAQYEVLESVPLGPLGG